VLPAGAAGVRRARACRPVGDVATGYQKGTGAWRAGSGASEEKKERGFVREGRPFFTVGGWHVSRVDHSGKSIRSTDVAWHHMLSRLASR
jgi:hypothetical protein